MPISYTNPSFLNDESQPPPYSSIYPFSISQNGANFDSKLNNQINENQESTNDHTSSNNYNQTTSSYVQSLNLFQENSNEPISYEQLFLNSTSNIQQNSFLSNQNNLNLNMENKIRKQFNIQFNKTYLLRHIVFITMSSLAIISFQIILMNNQSVLSNLASGLWSGFANLIIILISILTLKYAKLWILILTIMLHFLNIILSLGALIVINCIAVTKYTSCSNQPFYDWTATHCTESSMKYGNIGIIVLGACCMLTFSTFFFKLIAVFNNSQQTTND